jgi:hypothetical protein
MKYPACLLAAVAVAVTGCGGRGDGDEGPGAAAPPAIPDAMHGPSTDGDLDGDGVPNGDDNCPSVANADQRRACTYETRPALTGDVVADGVARINWTRQSVGLGPVVADPDLTRGCELHVSYLVQWAAEHGGPMLSHEEDLSLPYASEEGNRAGLDSVISYGQPNIGSAVDGWVNTLYHRLPLVHPGLERVGVAYDEAFACVQYRRGTNNEVRAPYPIYWPPPDVVGTDRVFGGNESPCPTAADPLAGGTCPGSAAIPTVGIHRWGAISNVVGTYTNLDTGAETFLYHTFWDGGATPHEMFGYLEGTIALVPQPGTSLDRGLYEVRIDADVDGVGQTFRWRFRTAEPLPEVGCDDMGAHHDIASALSIGAGEQMPGRICDLPDFFRVGGSGTRTVTVSFDHATGDIDVVATDEAGTEVARSDSATDREELTVPGGSYLQVYGFDGAMGPYIIRVE